MAKSVGLGRGLSSLLDDSPVTTSGSSSLNEIEMSKIEANPNQPRVSFDEELLNELAASIREIGLIQPITLRKMGDEKYQIIAGERRFRASKIAGLTKIPAYVKDIDADKEVLEMALVENIQREDLNPIEIAISYNSLIETCNLTQERLSERVGKKRATIANYIRLLKLPAEIQVGIKNKKIDFGHARTLVTIEDAELQLKLYEEILKNGYSVRKIEELVRSINEGVNVFENVKEEKNIPAKEKVSEEYELLRSRLSDFFKTKIQFSRSEKGKGKIMIPFNSDEELERIIDAFDNLI